MQISFCIFGLLNVDKDLKHLQFFFPFNQWRAEQTGPLYNVGAAMFTPHSGYYNHPLPAQLTNTSAVGPGCQRRKEETEQEKECEREKRAARSIFPQPLSTVDLLQKDAEIFKIS